MHKRFEGLTSVAVVLLLSACGGASGPTAIDTTVASVTVTGPRSNVTIGGTLQLEASPRNASGTVINGLIPTWSSSNPTVATVSSGGLVSGLVAGTATISATISGVVGRDALTTVPASQAATVDATPGLQFTPSQVDIAQGGTVTWQFGTVTHNVTFGAGSAGTPSNIGNTASANVSRTFATAGTFAYACTLHAGMSGTVVVH